jgi:hypothetical protein
MVRDALRRILGRDGVSPSAARNMRALPWVSGKARAELRKW